LIQYGNTQDQNPSSLQSISLGPYNILPAAQSKKILFPITNQRPTSTLTTTPGEIVTNPHPLK